MELEQQNVEIDGVTYALLQAPFFEAKYKAEKMTSLLRGVIDVSVKGQNSFDMDIKIPEILANITSPDFQEIQEFIIKNMQVFKDGELIKTDSKSAIAQHFNQYRSHYYKVIIAGAQFHFLDFLPLGKERLKSMIERVKKTTINTQMSNGSSTPQS